MILKNVKAVKSDMKKFELNKNGNRWVPSFFFCPACNGPLMVIEPRSEIEKSGVAFLECFRCKGKVIYEIEGDDPVYSFLPRNWTPKFIAKTEIFCLARIFTG